MKNFCDETKKENLIKKFNEISEWGNYGGNKGEDTVKNYFENRDKMKKIVVKKLS